MSDQNPAARGFSNGFFGCFGVLAAIVVVFFGLATCGRMSKPDKPSSWTSDVPDWKAPGQWAANSQAEKFADHCRLALLRFGDRLPGEGGVRPWPGRVPDIELGGIEPIIVCHGQRARGGQVAVTLQVTCANGDDGGCFRIQSGTVDGRPAP